MGDRVAILDVDGTLVDTNYHHALAWHRALRASGHRLPVWRVHRHIGMGGDQIVAALLGDEVERAEGDRIRAAEAEAYEKLIDEVEPMPGARRLLEKLHAAGVTVVLASSAKEGEVDRYLEMLGARRLVAGWTTSADVEATKPEPDLVRAALEKAGHSDGATMVGDSIWDVRAAGAAGLTTLAVLTGGFAAAELREAGAAAVYESLDELAGDERLLGSA